MQTLFQDKPNLPTLRASAKRCGSFAKRLSIDIENTTRQVMRSSSTSPERSRSKSNPEKPIKTFKSDKIESFTPVKKQEICGFNSPINKQHNQKIPPITERAKKKLVVLEKPTPKIPLLNLSKLRDNSNQNILDETRFELLSDSEIETDSIDSGTIIPCWQFKQTPSIFDLEVQIENYRSGMYAFSKHIINIDKNVPTRLDIQFKLWINKIRYNFNKTTITGYSFKEIEKKYFVGLSTGMALFIFRMKTENDAIKFINMITNESNETKFFWECKFVKSSIDTFITKRQEKKEPYMHSSIQSLRKSEIDSKNKDSTFTRKKLKRLLSNLF